MFFHCFSQHRAGAHGEEAIGSDEESSFSHGREPIMYVGMAEG